MGTMHHIVAMEFSKRGFEQALDDYFNWSRRQIVELHAAMGSHIGLFLE
jgi:hypothetical protein